MSDAITITEGASYEVPHPFVREKTTLMPDEPEGQPTEVDTWVPGIRFEPVYPDSGEAVADGLGAQTLSVVSIHKPGKYPVRVFYTRKWRDPAGKTFGKTSLRVKTLGAFRSLIKGYRHEFRLLSETAEAA